MNKLLSYVLAPPRAALILLAVSLGALAFALVMQFGFGFQPCILCLAQRVPFVVAAVLALIAALWKPYGRNTRVLLGLIALAFFLNAGLAFFHSGVERHWWTGTEGCTIRPLHATTPESLREELLGMTVAHCDEISWSLFGLSMANYNVPFCLGLGVFAAFAALSGGVRKNK